MKFVELGKSGLKVSVIALGTWQFGSRSWGYGKSYTADECVDAVKASVEAGVNLIDTAEVYGGGVSEEIVGKAVKQVDGEVFVATKVSPAHLTYDGVIKACDRSLRRLGLKTIDLYQIHFPNPLISLKQTMRAMEHLVKMGKIRFIGVSNFSRKLVQKAREHLKSEEIVSNQVKYNLIERNIEKDLMPYCMAEKITILAYSPLAQGILTGKYRKQNLPRDIIRRINKLYSAAYIEKAQPLLDELHNLAKVHGATMGQAALAWVASHQGCVAIAGAKNRQQAVENALAGKITLFQEEVEKLSQLSDKVKPTFADLLRAIPRIFNP